MHLNRFWQDERLLLCLSLTWLEVTLFLFKNAQELVYRPTTTPAARCFTHACTVFICNSSHIYTSNTGRGGVCSFLYKVNYAWVKKKTKKKHSFSCSKLVMHQNFSNQKFSRNSHFWFWLKLFWRAKIIDRNSDISLVFLSVSVDFMLNNAEKITRGKLVSQMDASADLTISKPIWILKAQDQYLVDAVTVNARTKSQIAVAPQFKRSSLTIYY